MADESLSARPIFASEETEYLESTTGPLSKVAVISFVLGLLSCLTTLSINLVVIAILAVAMGIGAYWQVSRQPGSRGQTLALLGISLGLGFAIWSVANLYFRNSHLYQISGQFSQHFLQLISKNELLPAYELMQPEPTRQVAGTSLEEHYKRIEGPELTSLQDYMNNPAVLQVKKHGEAADWQLDSGLRIMPSYDQALHISVRMRDKAQPNSPAIDVTLNRGLKKTPDGKWASTWMIVDLRP